MVWLTSDIPFEFNFWDHNFSAIKNIVFVCFYRAANHNNIEALVKLGIAYLYNEGREYNSKPNHIVTFSILRYLLTIITGFKKINNIP